MGHPVALNPAVLVPGANDRSASVQEFLRSTDASSPFRQASTRWRGSTGRTSARSGMHLGQTSRPRLHFGHVRIISPSARSRHPAREPVARLLTGWPPVPGAVLNDLGEQPASRPAGSRRDAALRAAPSGHPQDRTNCGCRASHARTRRTELFSSLRAELAMTESIGCPRIP